MRYINLRLTYLEQRYETETNENKQSEVVEQVHSYTSLTRSTVCLIFSAFCSAVQVKSRMLLSSSLQYTLIGSVHFRQATL